MKSQRFASWIVLVASGLFWSAAQAEDQPDAAKLYDLTYKFKTGETLRWEVVHKATVQTTIQGTTETAKTRSESVKAWKVTDVTPEGVATFVHSVESVKMANQLPNRALVEYDSQRDVVPPVGYEAAAKAVGIPLTMIRIDARGKLLKREARHGEQDADGGAPMVVRLPDEPVAIGATWNQSFEVQIRLKDGLLRRIKSRQRFELESVEGGVATIAVDYQVLDPKANRDPAILAQLVQRLSTGTVLLDIDTGRIIRQDLKVDRRVLGFSGPSSSLHYLMSFSERILKADEKVAKRPLRPAGPEPDRSSGSVTGDKAKRQ